MTWLEVRLLFPDELYEIFVEASLIVEQEASSLPDLPSVRRAYIASLMAAELTASRAGKQFDISRATLPKVTQPKDR